MQAEFNRKKLKEVREENNLTQEQLAELSEISDRHLRNLETASTKPSAEVLCRISYVLDVSMDDLMTIHNDS
jgi:transcriptional regulator with XRE-family HTH domain